MYFVDCPAREASGQSALGPGTYVWVVHWVLQWWERQGSSQDLFYTVDMLPRLGAGTGAGGS